MAEINTFNNIHGSTHPVGSIVHPADSAAPAVADLAAAKPVNTKANKSSGKGGQSNAAPNDDHPSHAFGWLIPLIIVLLAILGAFTWGIKEDLDRLAKQQQAQQARIDAFGD